MQFSDLFSSTKPIIGVIHLLPLPGAPLYTGNLAAIYERAIAETQLLQQYVQGLIVENFGDKPFYPSQVPVETVAAMAAIGREVVRHSDVPVGINILRNDAAAATAVATACGAHFVRVNVHTNAVVADQGLIQGRAYETLRLRQSLRSKVLIFADVGVKHATPLADRGLAIETQDLTERGLADAIIVSGTRTGEATNTSDLDTVKANTHLPVLIGSGTTPTSLPTLGAADGYIVGSYFKQNGVVTNDIEEERVRELVGKK